MVVVRCRERVAAGLLKSAAFSWRFQPPPAPARVSSSSAPSSGSSFFELSFRHLRAILDVDIPTACLTHIACVSCFSLSPVGPKYDLFNEAEERRMAEHDAMSAGRSFSIENGMFGYR